MGLACKCFALVAVFGGRVIYHNSCGAFFGKEECPFWELRTGGIGRVQPAADGARVVLKSVQGQDGTTTWNGTLTVPPIGPSFRVARPTDSAPPARTDRNLASPRPRVGYGEIVSAPMT